MDMEHKAISELGARHLDVVAYTRASRLVAARLNDNSHRGMIPGDECPHCYEVNVSVDDDPEPVWYDQCLSHRAEWEERQSTYICRIVDALDAARSTSDMADAPQLRRKLARAYREWREVSGTRLVSIGGAA